MIDIRHITQPTLHTAPYHIRAYRPHHTAHYIAPSHTSQNTHTHTHTHQPSLTPRCTCACSQRLNNHQPPVQQPINPTDHFFCQVLGLVAFAAQESHLWCNRSDTLLRVRTFWLKEYIFKRAWPTTNRGGVDAGVVGRAQRVFEGLQVLVERLEQGRGGGLSQPNGIGGKGIQPAPSISLARRVHFGAPLPDPVSNEWGNGYQDICLCLHSHRPMYIPWSTGHTDSGSLRWSCLHRTRISKWRSPVGWGCDRHGFWEDETPVNGFCLLTFSVDIMSARDLACAIWTLISRSLSFRICATWENAKQIGESLE